jgi:hypothetical protein
MISSVAVRDSESQLWDTDLPSECSYNGFPWGSEGPQNLLVSSLIKFEHGLFDFRRPGRASGNFRLQLHAGTFQAPVRTVFFTPVCRV